MTTKTHDYGALIAALLTGHKETLRRRDRVAERLEAAPVQTHLAYTVRYMERSARLFSALRYMVAEAEANEEETPDWIREAYRRAEVDM